MQTRFSRFLITLAFAPLLLSLSLMPVQAQDSTVGFDTDGLDRSELLLIETDIVRDDIPVLEMRNQRTGPDVGILSIAARQLLAQLDESRPEEGNSYRIRKYLESLQKMQANYTIAGKLDEASVLRECIEEFLARQGGFEPDPGNLTAFRDRIGQTHTFRVTGQSNGSIWGNGIYTDDSTLGTVAVHAGLLRDGQRGVVKVTILPGQDHYDGSSANGITSSSYEIWQGSYIIAPVSAATGAHGGAMPEEALTLVDGLRLSAPGARIRGAMPEEARRLVDELTRSGEKVSAARLWAGMDSLQKMLEAAQQADKLDEALLLREGIRALIIKMAGAQPDPGRLTALRGKIGKSFYFVVTGRATGSIWGSEVYTDDSDLGTVVVHAGLLREGQQGIIKVTIRPGCDGYEGSESHGIVSGSYEAWQGSYRVSAFRLPAR